LVAGLYTAVRSVCLLKTGQTVRTEDIIEDAFSIFDPRPRRERSPEKEEGRRN
jgi:hypothetical protein